MERRITRRQALGAAGTAGVALLVVRGPLSALGGLVTAAPAEAATSAATVAVTPTMTEGPYWIDEMLRRFDVRASTGSSRAQAGVPLALKINVLDAATGGPINGAHVDIWHANAYGLYSDEGGQPGGSSTAGQNFLRGYQVTGTDAGSLAASVDGQVSFKTIWPGWYQGRAIHIHVRVRTYDGNAVATNYTTQIFFSDADNDAVLSAAAPYNTRSPKTDPTTDETDNVLISSAHATNVVPVTGSVPDGFAATFTIGLAGAASNVAGSEPLTAVIASARVTKAENGRRTVVASVKVSKPVTVHASLVRDGKTVARATGHLPAGTHSLRLALGKSAAGGAATLKLVFAGENVTRARKVSIPA